MKNEYLSINLSLLEILHPLRTLCLSLPRHEHRLFDANDAPAFVANPASCHCLSLTLPVANNPAVNHCAAKLLSLRVRPLRSDLELEKEHRHPKREVS
jgi:hypothetical protein